MSDEQQNTSEPEQSEPQVTQQTGEVLQVRLGGQAGVRVQQQGGVAHHKVSAQGAVPDCRQVPVEVLADVRELLDGKQQLTAAETLPLVRDLLSPWL